MRKLSSIALAGIAIVLTTASFGLAAPTHGGMGHAPSGHVEDHHEFDGHHGFDGRHDFDRRSHGGAFIGVPFGWAPYYPYDYPPADTYAPQAPVYWYCPSYGAYYPTAPSCPEAWVPVPAQ